MKLLQKGDLVAMSQTLGATVWRVEEIGEEENRFGHRQVVLINELRLVRGEHVSRYPMTTSVLYIPTPAQLLRHRKLIEAAKDRRNKPQP